MKFWKTITTVFTISSSSLRWKFWVLAFLLLGLQSCAWGNRKISQRSGFNREQRMQSFYKTQAVSVGTVFRGEASYYGPGFHGKKTASGEIFDQNALTCAHKTLPFGTRLKVTRLDNHQSVVVTVNDRGPYKKGRILDLSVAAARQIGLNIQGVAQVKAEVISVP